MWVRQRQPLHKVVETVMEVVKLVGIEENEEESILILYSTGVEERDILPGNASIHYNQPIHKKR